MAEFAPTPYEYDVELEYQDYCFDIYSNEDDEGNEVYLWI